MAHPPPTISDDRPQRGRVEGRGVVRAQRPARGRARDRDRILAAAAELGWTPSHRARALAASRALAVGTRDPAPAGDPRRRPVLPGFIAGIESALSPLGPVPAPAGRARPRPRARGLPRLAADGRVDGVFLTDLRVDDPGPPCSPRSACRPSVIGPSATDHEAAPCVASTTGPASSPPSSHLVELGHRASPTSPARPSSCTGVSRRRPGPVLCTRRACRGPVRPVRLLGPGRRATPPRHCSTCRAAHRDRLRQRPDGDRRHGRGCEPRPRRAG
jgi:hypothetical protein